MTERLQILLDNSIIDSKTMDFLLEVIDLLKQQGFAEKDMETFITHLAMATMRCAKGETVQCDPEQIKSDIIEDAGHHIYDRACFLWETLSEKSYIAYSDGESQFVLLHLCAMISKRKGAKTMKIVVGGQLAKEELVELVKKVGGDRVEVTAKTDVEAAMDVKSGKADYYLGSCQTGGGGSLAMAIALCGYGSCVTVASTGNVMSDEDIVKAVSSGKKCFGIVVESIGAVVPVLVGAMLAEKGE